MTLSKSGEKVGFEKVFEIIGGNGRYQWILTWILSLQLICLTWNHLSYIFIGAVPNHWCKVEELSQITNWTLKEIREISIPKFGNGNKDSEYESCSYYNLDYESLVLNSKGNYKAALDYIKATNESINGEKKNCDRWVYDDSIYSSTIVTEFDLVCGRRYLAATIQSTYMIGGLIGTFIFGASNDRVLGRRNSTLISISLALLGGFAATLSNSYWLFISFRMVIAIGTSGCLQAGSVLILEHCSIDSRAKFYSLSGAFFGVGYAIMPIYAYFIRDWSLLQLAFSSTSLILLSYIWIMPESPRWLGSMGRDEEAVKSLQKIAKVNGKIVQDKSQLLIAVQSCHKHHADNIQDEKNFRRNLRNILYNFKSLVDTREGLKRTLTVWTLFIACAFVYYGFAFSTNLTSNPYLLVALGGLMEIPANIIPYPFLSMWGRRPTTVLCYFLTGLFALAIAATPPEYESIRILLTMGGKFFIAAAFTAIYLVIAEVYPTVSRTTGQSTGTIMGRFGSITAPYVADMLTTVYPDLPCILFGIVSIFGAGVALLLPETKDMEMLDQVSELEMDKL